MARSTRRSVKQAGKLEDKERWAEAATRYREALQSEPARSDLWERLGRALHRSQDWLAAAEAYRMAIALGGASGRTYFRLGRVLQKTDRWAEARVAFQQAERSDRRRPSLKGVKGKQLAYNERLAFSLVSKPAYAYALFHGARLAKQLGVPRIAALEFGVAGGNGLLAMERHAADIESMMGVEIEVYGFDTGEGLFAPKDNRDMPHVFAEGNYQIDLEALEKRLTRAELILGDAATTFPDFLARASAPVGAVSFDMDMYAPTREVLASMRDGASDASFLPRIPMYFDDVVGKGVQYYNDFAGELLAIREFNEENESTKVAEDRYFRSLPLNFAWHHSMYMQHRFAHADYGRNVSSAGPATLALR